ncbi:MAG TPA: lysophospholipid acyltransferase family protein [Moraxellaceae bacterium]|nr:lysophospholipid acyltransferase family protein [Moraxellaceae bacterium]
MDDIDTASVALTEPDVTDTLSPAALSPAPDTPRPIPRPQKPSRLRDFISRRALSDWSAAGMKDEFIRRTESFWRLVHDHYFRVETTGWERLPDGPVILVGVHAGTWLTMDAWMLQAAWWFHFRESRALHCTCHDVLLAMPGLRSLFHQVGVIPASREAVTTCLADGHSVVIWPGGEVDAMRSWKRRGEVELGGRRGFIRQAIRSGVPIVPVATVGGADTVFVISEGRWLARKLQLKRLLRSEMAPIVAGLPFGIWLEALPSHIPLPSKIRYEFLEPLAIDATPGRESDDAYVDAVYAEVEARLQSGVDRLMAERRFPILG